ncbi:nucleoside deaminase [Neptunomonas phycophila]|jgi:tRNA(Arg) A34 adenosine deaminase TadA|uniref:Nucleoside deaminase n=1 Tax=Neptunomonas phycophila TaxID=1572645 RepID=A0AAW7XPI5_9GAMM|nr:MULTISPECIES: hypothetical protein [Neptunomonas]MBT3146531.1 nucleoside deaminase [Neptunomonas phycophila]MDN2658802.1 nucleoside deaminase [Neptunomonas sp. CHC150]MDO6454853.1 nucleoside deaminase [Neptunomonas phycophila]MDO6469004.1 nucleoside deaminase [Neptunomonas phycophila]MDO6785019.1 nucleoside deaminase [Neptunomonas phycophila]
MDFSHIEERLSAYKPDPEFRDDAVGLQCCQLAFSALKNGDYGVGAILLDPDGAPLIFSQNAVFSDGFCSSGHAEMKLLDLYEASYRSKYEPDELKLVVSLEPCPMCLSRLILSGIGIIKYMVDDAVGGMVNRIDHMPPAWRNLASLQSFYRAHISSDLKLLAKDIAQARMPELRAKLMNERVGQHEFEVVFDSH